MVSQHKCFEWVWRIVSYSFLLFQYDISLGESKALEANTDLTFALQHFIIESRCPVGNAWNAFGFVCVSVLRIPLSDTRNKCISYVTTQRNQECLIAFKT